MPRVAIVNQPTIALRDNGHPGTLHPGTYPIVELDGVPGSVAYIEGTDSGALVCINASDPNIAIIETED